ncbi:MAG: carboxymuconolactone decarboxylase family protein [Phaeodactylibacter sp.]|nr:carboxymuconolactone decarboxylase family protein [Phaeodactylibacter sp.]
MQNFQVPQKSEVNEQNQAIFAQLEKQVGFVPNLYATMAHSDTALGNYLQLQGAKTSLNNKEKEVVNLAVSQVNGCRYCQSAHTAIGKMNGFTDEQILDLRAGSAPFNAKFDALAKFAKAVAETQGRPNEATVEQFFAAGYTKGNLVDVLLLVADKIFANYLHNLTQIPIDFPVAPELEAVNA